jgi:hypothetical protein
MATSLHVYLPAQPMEEPRKAARFAVRVPPHVCMINGLPELHTGQLRDISRTGILFHSQVSFEVGTNLALTFCLPPEKDRTTCVLVRASSKTLRTWELPGQPITLYGVAVVIERIDFLRLTPLVTPNLACLSARALFNRGTTRRRRLPDNPNTLEPEVRRHEHGLLTSSDYKSAHWGL